MVKVTREKSGSVLWVVCRRLVNLLSHSDFMVTYDSINSAVHNDRERFTK